MAPSAGLASVSPSVLGWWRGKDSNLRRRKPADLQSALVGRLGTPPQNEPRIVILRWRGVNAFLARNLLAGPVYPPPPGPGSGSDPTNGRPQTLECRGIPPADVPGTHVPWELDRAVADTQQAADLEADGLPQRALLAVSAFVQHHTKAAVGRLPGGVGADAIEPCRPILENDPLEKEADQVKPVR